MAKQKRESLLNDQTAGLETVKLSSRERDRLLREMDMAALRGMQSHLRDRRDTRLPFKRDKMLFALTHPNGATMKHIVTPRNLSQGGIAFLIGQFVYADSVCEMAIPDLQGQWQVVTGKVLQCRHISGVFHEASMVFDSPIDLNVFIDPEVTDGAAATETATEAEMIIRDTSRKWQAKIEEQQQNQEEAVAFPEMDCATIETVLIADEFIQDRLLLKQFASDIDLAVDDVGSIDELWATVKKDRVDVIMIDLHIESDNGIETILRLRDRGYEGSIVACSAELSGEVWEQAQEAGCDAYLAKPFTREEIQTLMSSLLAYRLDQFGDDHAVCSTLSGDESIRQLLRPFVRSLKKIKRQISQYQSQDDAANLRRVCRQLKGSGASYGYEELTQRAEAVMRELDKQSQEDVSSLSEVREQIDALVEVLNRVRA